MADVTIYTSNTCPYCTMAKDYLDEKGIQYNEKNINEDSNAKKELIDRGHMGVPVIIIDDEEIVGFNKPRLEEILNK